MFRRIIAIALFAVLAAGCSVSISTSKADPSKAPSSKASVRAGAGVGTPAARESLFPGVVHQHIPKTAILSNTQLVTLGKHFCGGMDSLQADNQLEVGAYIGGFVKGLKGVFTKQEAVKFAGYSIAAFCPKYEEFMN